MKIYLDTWVFQKFFKTGLSEQEILFLDSIFHGNKHQIVLSATHLFELLAGQDKQRIMKTAILLDAIANKIWIKSNYLLEIMEIKLAYNIFRNWPPLSLAPFSTSPIELLEPNEGTLELLLNYRNKSISDLIAISWDPIADKGSADNLNSFISTWGPKNTEIAQKLTKETWPIEIKKRLKEMLEYKIIHHRLVPIEESGIENFINFLIDNPNLIMSFYFPFHLEHFLLKNSSSFKSSHIGDLSACSTIPYVDQIVLDGRMCRLAKQAISSMTGLKEFKLRIEPKLNESVNELMYKMSSM